MQKKRSAAARTNRTGARKSTRKPVKKTGAPRGAGRRVSARRTAGRPTPLEAGTLQLVGECLRRSAELAPSIERVIGASLYEFWVQGRRKAQGESLSARLQRWRRQRLERGATPGGAWRYVFHDNEIDLEHGRDRRMIRIDIGPGGRKDAFTPMALRRYLTGARSPWREFPELQRALGGLNELDESVLHKVCESLLKKGLVERADERLARLVESNLRRDAQGRLIFTLPADTAEQDLVDLPLAFRLVLTESGRRYAERA